MSARALVLVCRSLLLVLLLAGPAAAQDRQVVVSDGDYYGFDLRTLLDVDLDTCTSACLDDPQCRAFTYNKRASRCFLKSDFAELKPFPDAVAGKLVAAAGEPEIGAAPALAFLPDYIRDEAQRYRQQVARATADAAEGIGSLVEAAAAALAAGDPRTARDRLLAAVAVEPADPALWLMLARATVAIQPVEGDDTYRLQQHATSAGFNAYSLSRTAGARAETLALLARALDARSLYRPAIESYKASLELAESPDIRARLADLRARRGFRVVEHSIDADAATPRACVQFSESLIKSGTDYASFVTLDGTTPKSVEAGDRQICVGGLEHGRTYRLAIRSGLPAAIGEIIEQPVALSLYVRDRAPAARFTGDSFVLPSTARRGIPLVTVNAERAELALYRVGERALAQLLAGSNFLRQIDGYDVERIATEIGAPVWQGTIDIAPERNRDVVTSFPVDEAVPQRQPGVYLLTAVPQGDRRDGWEQRATQWFVVSDIGLATFAGDDGLTVFARSLATAKPLAGVELGLVARNNEILGTAVTDGDGRARFTAGLARGTGSFAPAVLTAALGAADFVFLDMARAGFDLSDRGVAGRAPPKAIDVFAWTERGIYRAGETVHAAALARDAAADALPDLPLTFVVRRPDGVEAGREVSSGAALGGHAVEFPLPQNAMRGTWTLRVHADAADAPLAEKPFLVEDFVPDRIEFDLTAPTEDVEPGAAATVTVDGRYLYGAPAAGLAMEGELVVSAVREWTAYDGYYFGLVDEAVEDQRVTLEDLPELDDAGHAELEVRLDNLPSTTRLLTAEVVIRLREGGGRAVERRGDISIAPSGPVIGVKPQFDRLEVPESSTARFAVVAVGRDGERIDLPGLSWSLSRVERQYQWYREGNGWNYEPVEFTRAVADGTVDARADGDATVEVAVGWGRYRLEVAAPAADGAATSVDFSGGWVVEATSTETPDGLEIGLDKASYRAGETARLTVSPRFAGELLVTVGAERLREVRTVSVPEGGASLDIPVGADWGAGAYVTATLYRPGDAQESRMPMRAIGVAWLAVDPGPRRLAVSLGGVDRTEPNRPLAVPVTLDSLPPGEPAYVAVAAVDVGILNLTRYETPDPAAWYYGQRRLGLELRDLYGRLIDGSLGAAGRIRSGGDAAAMGAEGAPPTERLLAFFSGPVEVDAQGAATVTFDLPQFNGSARIMAVAWSRTAVGHAAREVIVRDPVVVTASLPRVLAPGDRSRLQLDIANTDGPVGDYVVDVTADGTVALGDSLAPRIVTLAAGQRVSLTVPLAADEPGTATVSVHVSHADGIDVGQTLIVPVRPAVQPVTTRTAVALAPGATQRLDRGLLAGRLLRGAEVAVSVRPTVDLDVPAMLMALDRYPYGCAEQTTSRALPLLYVSELSKAYGLADDPALGERLSDAVTRVLAYQSSAGSFGLWGPGFGDLWLDAYVSEFLTRAREAGHAVPEEAMLQALENLQNSLAYDRDLRDWNAEVAYALYVLARNRRASAGDLRYYADTRLDEFATPMARAQIAASLALYGDAERAERAFASALELAQTAPAGRSGRNDYGSPLRDAAAMLALAAEARPQPASLAAMSALVADRAAAASYTSTQDNAWLVLAARALEGAGGELALDVDGTAHRGRYAARLSGESLAATPVAIVNRGPEPAQVTLTTLAAPDRALPAGGTGFTIERAYYQLDGSAADLAQARQNERFVVVLTMSESNQHPSRVLVADLLPGGFEIDNPRLVGSAELAAFDWLGEVTAAHSEFRFDRFVAAFTRDAGSPRRFTAAYVVRAVTPGDYTLPAATVEDMYRPELSARTAEGRIEVTGAAP